MPRRKGRGNGEPRRQTREAMALVDLDRLRQPLFREMAELRARAARPPREAEHLCCLRERNQMRISPLEARAIARAFAENPALRSKLPAVLERLRSELLRLEEGTGRQKFDCPLLEGTRCLVHHHAKPIGCLAWNPGRAFSKAGWEAFAGRDALNDQLYGRDWKLRVIPLWLGRVFAAHLGRDHPKNRG